MCLETDVQFWQEYHAIFFLKSYIHLYTEDDALIPSLLFLSFTKIDTISFRGLGSFRLQISHEEMKEILLSGSSSKDWKDFIVFIAGDFQYVFENTEKLSAKFTINNNIRDYLCLFILSCLELYEMESENYPLYKWLMNLHFKPHHH